MPQPVSHGGRRECLRSTDINPPQVAVLADLLRRAACDSIATISNNKRAKHLGPIMERFLPGGTGSPCIQAAISPQADRRVNPSRGPFFNGRQSGRLHAPLQFGCLAVLGVLGVERAECQRDAGWADGRVDPATSCANGRRSMPSPACGRPTPPNNEIRLASAAVLSCLSSALSSLSYFVYGCGIPTYIKRSASWLSPGVLHTWRNDPRPHDVRNVSMKTLCPSGISGRLLDHSKLFSLDVPISKTKAF